MPPSLPRGKLSRPESSYQETLAVRVIHLKLYAAGPELQNPASDRSEIWILCPFAASGFDAVVIPARSTATPIPIQESHRTGIKK